MIHDGQLAADASYVPAGEGQACWVVGDTYTFKATGESTGGGLALLEASVPPGSGPPPHVHSNEDEAFYVLAGELEISTEEETFNAGEGDFVFVPRGTPHHFKNLGTGVARALILLTPAGFERFFTEVGVPVRAGEQAPTTPADQVARIVELAPHYGTHILIPAGGYGGVAPRGSLARRLFATIDSMDPTAIGELFSSDARLVFGNGVPMVGRDAIVAGIRGFFSTIHGLRHRIAREWRLGRDTVAETEVTYRRVDGKEVSVPAVSIWRTRDDGRIDDYRIYADLAPVYAA